MEPLMSHAVVTRNTKWRGAIYKQSDVPIEIDSRTLADILAYYADVGHPDGPPMRRVDKPPDAVDAESPPAAPAEIACDEGGGAQ